MDNCDSHGRSCRTGRKSIIECENTYHILFKSVCFYKILISYFRILFLYISIQILFYPVYNPLNTIDNQSNI